MSDLDDLANAARSSGGRPPTRQRSSELTVIFGLLIAGGVAAVIAVATHTWKPPGTTIQTLVIDVPPEPKSPMPKRVEAGALVAAYRDNELAADNQYRFELVTVRGYVSSIQRDLNGYPFLTLQGRPGEPSLANVHCTFPSEQEPALMGLRKGDRVAVVGRCRGKALLSVMIDASGVEDAP